MLNGRNETDEEDSKLGSIEDRGGTPPAPRGEDCLHERLFRHSARGTRPVSAGSEEEGDLLILALNSDVSVRAIKGERRPLLPEAERAEVVASLETVDYVTLFNETTPLRLIEYLRPDVLVKGGDWKEEAVVGRDAVRSWGGEVVLVPLVEGASTTNIVEKVLRAYGQS